MSSSPSAPQKRLAAIWFADIMGYTALSGSDGAEALRLVRLLQSTTRFRVRQFGGRVVKFMGDAAFAEFASANDACRAALAVEADFRAGAKGGALRAGIHVGEVTPSSDGDLYGDTVNLAARLQTAAAPGHVVASDDVRRLVRADPELRWAPLGTWSLKGVAEEVTVYAITYAEGAAPAPLPLGGAAPAAYAPRRGTGAGHAPPRFFGREPELRSLDAWLGEALQERGRVAFVAGEAGRGKTALLTEFARQAQEAHPTLLVAGGFCDAKLGLGDAYGLFRDVLRQLLVDPGGGEPALYGANDNAERLTAFLPTAAAVLLDRGPDLIGTLVSVHDLLQRFGMSGGGEAAWPDRLEAAAQQRAAGGGSPAAGFSQVQLFEQCTNVLRAISAVRPLLLILDDLHWADEASVSLLFHLARRVTDAPILLVGGYRPADIAIGPAGARHPLEPVLNELQRLFGEVTLDLDSSGHTESRTFLDALVDAEPNELDEAFRDALYRRTEGHALFTVELLRHLRERGDLVHDARGVWVAGPTSDWETLPASVEAVIEERIKRLDAELREALTVASVEGDEFIAEVVAQVRTAEPRALVRRFSGELDRQHRLVATQGLRRVGRQRLSLYRFGHNAVQRYLYSRLDAAERSYLHEDVGRSLEELYADEPEEVVARLAHHYAEAGDVEKAATYSIRAGEHARRQYAGAEARLHFHRAVQMLAGERAAWAQELRLRAREQLGEVLALAADHAQARAEFQTLLSEAPASANVWRARLVRRIGSTWTPQHRTDEALACLAQADAFLGGAQTRDDTWNYEWVQVQIERLQALYYAGRVGELGTVAEAVSTDVQAKGTPEQRANFLTTLCIMRFRRERFVPGAETEALATAAVRAAEETQSLISVARARFGHAFVYLLRRDLAAAEAGLQETQRLAERTGDQWTGVLCWTYLTAAARLAGNVERVRERNSRAIKLATAAEMPTYIGAAEGNAAWLAHREGVVTETEAAARRALDHWKDGGIAYPLEWLVRFPLLALEHGRGRHEEAVREARRILDPVQQQLPPEVAEPLGRAVEAWDGGDAALAGQALDLALGPARHLGYL
jgi:class 3 adenylate cyclase